MIWWMGFPYVLAGLGFLFYVSHFPEIKVGSGIFDIYGSSHQIWHVLIFLGEKSIQTCRRCWKIFKWRLHYKNTPCV